MKYSLNVIQPCTKRMERGMTMVKDQWTWHNERQIVIIFK